MYPTYSAVPASSSGSFGRGRCAVRLLRCMLLCRALTATRAAARRIPHHPAARLRCHRIRARARRLGGVHEDRHVAAGRLGAGRLRARGRRGGGGAVDDPDGAGLQRQRRGGERGTGRLATDGRSGSRHSEEGVPGSTPLSRAAHRSGATTPRSRPQRRWACAKASRRAPRSACCSSRCTRRTASGSGTAPASSSTRAPPTRCASRTRRRRAASPVATSSTPSWRC
jgi:hypothetical protein